jgi:aryl-alcohol dehydrogenase-like predicted oxidoreductase
VEKRPLGRTGLEIPVIGFGTAPNAVLMTDPDEEFRIRTIRFALESGVTHFDTSAKYGGGKSETNLGRALRVLGATPTISTKVALYPPDLPDPRSAVLRSFEGSLKRLQVERVAVLLLHNRVFDDPDPDALISGTSQLSRKQVFGTGGVAEAFTELLASGAVDAIGFTTLGGDPGPLSEMIDSGVFGVLNAVFNVLDPSALLPVPAAFESTGRGRVILQATARGMGVMAVKVLAGGVLGAVAAVAKSATAGADRRPPLDSQGQLTRVVAAVAAEIGTTTSELAVRYALSKPGISSAIIGFSRPEHVAEAVDAASNAPLAENYVRRLERAFDAPQIGD